MPAPERAIAEIVRHHFQEEVAFLQRLVRAKSANPFLPAASPPDAPIEAEVAALIHQELRQLGWSATSHGVSPQRPNVLCRIPGAVPTGKTLILTAHMDTVEPTGYRRDPWGGQVEQGRLYGVGAADAKAQIAAFVYAVQALVHAGNRLAGELVLAFVADEEPGACSPYGTRYLLEQGLLTGDAAIIGEPGDQKIAIGHRGLYRFRLVIQGEATHTGIKAWEQGRQGRNAILDMARLTLALAASPLPATPSAAFPGRRSVLTFPTMVRGGSAINIVPGECEAWGEARLLPGLSGEDVKRLMIERLAQLDITHYTLEDLVAVPAVEIPQEAEIVQALARAAEAITGTRPRLGGSGPTCDGWMFVTRGIPTICGYGVAGGGVHGADEWVDLDSLRRLTQIYAEAMIRYLGPEEQST